MDLEAAKIPGRTAFCNNDRFYSVCPEIIVADESSFRLKLNRIFRHIPGFGTHVP